MQGLYGLAGNKVGKVCSRKSFGRQDKLLAVLPAVSFQALLDYAVPGKIGRELEEYGEVLVAAQVSFDSSTPWFPPIFGGRGPKISRRESFVRQRNLVRGHSPWPGRPRTQPSRPRPPSLEKLQKRHRGGGRHRRADPGPHGRLTVKLDGPPQQRLQRGPGHAHRGSKHARLHPLDARPRAALRLPLRLGTASNFVVHMSEADNVYDSLCGSFAGDQGAWSTAKMYFTVPPNGVAKLHFGAHFQAPGLPNQTAGTVDVYGLQILDATLEAGNTAEEEDTAASALLLKHEFLDGGADDVTLATLRKVLLEPTLTTLGNFLVRSNTASFAVGGFQLEGYAMTLSAFAWNIVRTYTLTPGRRYSFGCWYRLGTASNLVMYVSAADNDYVGVTGTFLGTASQGVWSTARWTSRRRRAESRSCTSEPSAALSPGWCSSWRARWTCTACRSGPAPSRESLSR